MGFLLMGLYRGLVSAIVVERQRKAMPQACPDVNWFNLILCSSIWFISWVQPVAHWVVKDEGRKEAARNLGFQEVLVQQVPE